MSNFITSPDNIKKQYIFIGIVTDIYIFIYLYFLILIKHQVFILFDAKRVLF